MRNHLAQCGIKKTTILILGQVRLYREALSCSLSAYPEINVTGATAAFEASLPQIAQAGVAVVVIDVPTIEDLEMIKALTRELPGIKIIAIVPRDDDDELLKYVEAGIAGYVTTEGSTDDLARAILRSQIGEAACSPRMVAALLRRVAELSGAAQSEELKRSPLTHRKQGDCARASNLRRNCQESCPQYFGKTASPAQRRGCGTTTKRSWAPVANASVICWAQRHTSLTLRAPR
jgi:DNA-binding NarL/FixJ family response regulator